MGKLRNEFSWSVTRDSVFRACLRQYYFNYYGYWGGWEIGCPARTRLIYILKNLKNRFMWAGEKVHECIKHTLRNLQRGISVLDADRIVEITLKRMREEFRSSREGRYLAYPKTCALFEHEYELSIADEEWKRVAEDVERCLRNFYASEIFASLKALPLDKWLEIEDFSSFYLEGTRVWAVIDCSFRTDEGVTIIDWKTGRGTSRELSTQLACYAMYGTETWRTEPERIKLIDYNLLADERAEFSVTAGEIDEVRSYIKGSIDDMQSLLADVENNMPKGEASFPKVGDERIRERCNFRKVCDRTP